MKNAFRDPGAVLTAVGEPTQSGLVPIYVSKGVTTLRNL
jgi:hypothetical protein